ncbi:TonB-dependent receptor [Croceibacterium sp. TMG7-5b_MA50]|uniref:TonB-dependent receptor n=1 Tax=Croceibacterium sp. TMG7-5b_MA50 TaxID=3121290 RepID=UPI003222111B
MPRQLLLAASCLAGSLLVTPVLAQQQVDGDRAEVLRGPIIVTAPGLARLDLLAGTSVIEGEDLQRNLKGQIGDVIAKLPGVSTTAFVPGASRPILRGLGGDRVRVLVDDLGTADAGNVSDDHAVTVDPLIAQRVEVLRGPAVLLYGSQAIGGAVNVETSRLPDRVPDAPQVNALVGADTAFNRFQGGASFDLPLSQSLSFHVDGAYQETGDLEIPGYAVAPDLRTDLLADAAEHAAEGEAEEAAELTEAASRRRRVPNSASEQKSAAASLNWFSGNSSLGAAFSWYDTAYGVPERPGAGHAHSEEAEDHDHDHDHAEHEHEEGHEHGDVTIGMQQYRGDLKGVLDLGTGFFDELRTRWAYTDYRHTEFEGDEVGTVFTVETVEGRAELVQTPRDGWSGSIGAQYLHTDFGAVGAEAFVPPNVTETFALFALQSVELGLAELQAGARYDNTSIDVETLGEQRDFDGFSGSLGLSLPLGGTGLRAGVVGSHAERAPTTTELFAEGPHIATQQFEIGNADLDKERSWGLEGYVRGSFGGAQLSASVYHSWFDNFIYLTDTGVEEDGLPVSTFAQGGMNLFGAEGEVQFPLVDTSRFDLAADLRATYTRATLDEGGPVPRIPPLSLLGALQAGLGPVDARAEVQWFDDQDRLADGETPTDGFTFVNLSLGYHPLPQNENVLILLQLDNVFAKEGRNHASFTKDFVPLAGRNFRVSARISL